MKEIILYGAGKGGEFFLQFILQYSEEFDVICFCDKKANEGFTEFLGKPVLNYEEAKAKNVAFYITTAEPIRSEVSVMLKEDNQEFFATTNDLLQLLPKEKQTPFLRDFCQHFHVESMDDYFNDAEQDDVLNCFWSETAGLPFYKFFKNLDLENVIELACGRGRHVQKYINKAKSVTLVDILEKNIQFCQERYSGFSNVSYYKNNGYNLEELAPNSYTALFCYDAMVHFEMLDIYHYLNDIQRVLKKDGYVLLHHSNNHDPKASFGAAEHGRAFMTRELFAHMSFRAGFDVVEQKLINWGSESSNDFVENCDCISLLKKI